MNLFRFLLVLLVVAAMPVRADDQGVGEIRSYYNEISSEVTRCSRSAEAGGQQESLACRLYLVEISENRLNAPVAAVGIYHRTIRRWYDLSGPSGTKGEGYEPNAQTLVRVEIDGERSAVKWYEEYLYKGGELLFYFRKSDFGEYRFYFGNGELVRFAETGRPEGLEDDSYSMQQGDWKQVLKQAGCQQQSDVSADGCSGSSHGAAAVPGPGAGLCDSGTSTVPEDLRMPEEDHSIDKAIAAVDFLQREVFDRLTDFELGNTGKDCRLPDCIAGIPWDNLNIGAPNAMMKLRGTLLRLQALYLSERSRGNPDEIPEEAVRRAVEAYCTFVGTAAVAD